MTLEIAFPDSSLSDCSTLRDKTVKVGLLARALSVFKVERVTLYETKRHEQYRRDLTLLDKLLRYMDTPQYLRRAVFPMSPSLKYAGLLPPLRTRYHPLAISESKIVDGDLRWGIQTRPGYVDIGLDEPIKYDGSLGTRVPTLFRLGRSGSGLVLEPTTRESSQSYFGYEVRMTSNLVEYLLSQNTHTKVVLSRLGVPFQSISKEIGSVLESTGNLLAIFGGPHSGVRDLVHDRNGLKQSIDYWINTILNQGTETVRLEEAVWVSLGLFNTSFGNLVTKGGYYEK